MSDNSNNASFESQQPDEPKKRLIVAVMLIALISFVAWVLSSGGKIDGADAPVSAPATVQEPSTPNPAPVPITLVAIPASIVTVDELMSATKGYGFPIYWNGEVDETNIELTVLTEGKVFVRYLPKDIPAGATEPFFTVASYYDPDAFGKVQSLGVGSGAKYIRYKGGAVAASASESDSNVYFAFDGNPVLYNIYSPDPQFAWLGLDTGTLKILQ